MLPSDVIGVSVYNPIAQEFEFKPGPIFANIIVADEINRTTPKTQSALLEAMNESQITVDNHTHPLPKPFLVLATQNPIEHHGTYPLPESQLDRFLMRIRMGYPARESEKEIIRNNAGTSGAEQVARLYGCGRRNRHAGNAFRVCEWTTACSITRSTLSSARARPSSSAWASAREAP